MKQLFSSLVKTSILFSISLILLGIFLIFKSEATIFTISYVLGAGLIAVGVITELNYLKENQNGLEKNDFNIVYGVVCIILGIIVIKTPEAIASIIPLVIGVIIIANSTLKMQYSLELKKENNELWTSTFVLSIIMLICGIILIFNPFKGAVILTKIVGIFILVYAVLDLISTFVIRNTIIKIKEAVKESVKEAEIIEEKKTKQIEDKKDKDDKDDKPSKKKDK